MIKNLNFEKHNALYTVLCQQILKPGKNLFSKFMGQDTVEKEGVFFRDITEIEFTDKKYIKEFMGFKYFIDYSDSSIECFNKSIVFISGIGQGLMISMDKGRQWPFFLSDFAKLPNILKPETEFDMVSKHLSIGELDTFGKYVLIENLGLERDDIEVEKIAIMVNEIYEEYGLMIDNSKDIDPVFFKAELIMFHKDAFDYEIPLDIINEYLSL